MPDWVGQMAAAAALSVIAWFLRGLRTDVDAIKLDMVSNYVTHKHFGKLERAQDRTLKLLIKLQLQLARHFGFKPADITDDHEDDENES